MVVNPHILSCVHIFLVSHAGRPDGTRKERAVDDFSWSAGGASTKRKRKVGSVNGHCLMPEKVQHDHLDDLMAAVKVHLA